MLLQFVEVASWKTDMLLKREAHQALTVPGSNQEASRPKVNHTSLTIPECVLSTICKMQTYAITIEETGSPL